MVVGTLLVFAGLNVMEDRIAIVLAIFGSTFVGSGVIAHAIATTFEKYLEKMRSERLIRIAPFRTEKRQNQTDELKRELEDMKQDRESGTK